MIDFFVLRCWVVEVLRCWGVEGLIGWGVEVLRCWGVQRFNAARSMLRVQCFAFKCSNVQLFPCSNVPCVVLSFSNFQIFKSLFIGLWFIQFQVFVQFSVVFPWKGARLVRCADVPNILPGSYTLYRLWWNTLRFASKGQLFLFVFRRCLLQGSSF